MVKNELYPNLFEDLKDLLIPDTGYLTYTTKDNGDSSRRLLQQAILISLQGDITGRGTLKRRILETKALISVPVLLI